MSAAPEAARLIDVVVVGAHMTGLPLNPQLVSLGAVFRRTARTTAAYRLFAIPGGPPRRPGLLRVAPGRGGSIETEVWALPPAGFGNLVASIPAPLCIGTVLLDDGSSPKGFLVEPEGLANALDITGFGGWRAYTSSLDAAPGLHRPGAADATASPCNTATPLIDI